MITSISRGLDYCGLFLGAGKVMEEIDAMPGCAISYVAYMNTNRNLIITIYESIYGEENRLSYTDKNYSVALREISKRAKSKIDREAAAEKLEYLKWWTVEYYHKQHGNKLERWQEELISIAR